MPFRLGVHAGDISVADDRWDGDAINVAARLQSLAEPGGINVSRSTLDAAGDIPARVESLGPQRLKNIPEPVVVFRLVDEAIDDDRTKPWRRRIPTSARQSLAVSPFVNYGADEDSHFADGLMMALVISLMRIPGLDVVSETSTLGYRDLPFSAQELDHELGVKYVLEGAAQRSGSKVRVLTQLIDVDGGTTAWADRFEASFDDVLAAQDDIVSSIVTALDIEVIGGDVARRYRSRVTPEPAKVLYRGLQYLSVGTPDDLQHAIDSFEGVIELQPDAPSGYTLAAMTHNWMAMFGATDDPARLDHVEALGVETLPTVGSGPHGSISEPGQLIDGLARSAAVALGDQFGQAAIYEWDEDRLEIIDVRDQQALRLGWRLIESTKWRWERQPGL
jgi:adenylate cyclase